MRWSWQQPDWPNFSYPADLLKEFDQTFALQANYLWGDAKTPG